MQNNFSQRLTLLSLVLVSFFLLLTGCQETEPIYPTDPVDQSNFLLGTVVTITLYDHATDDVFKDAFERIKDIENKMSINIKDSEVIEINAQAGQNGVKVSEDTFKVIEKGKHYSELSKGGFDITIGPLVQLWNIGTDEAAVPDQMALDAKLPLVDYTQIELNPSNHKIKLNKENMILDLGGIAKGYAADEVVKVLNKHGVEHAIINLGGNVFAHGTKLDGSPWRIGIQNPFDTRNKYLGIVQISDQSVVTSGVYERHFEENGKHYHHILDPKTGYPIDNGLAGVSIIADKSIDADGLSTSLFALGYEDGLKLVETLEGVDALFITNDSDVYMSSGLTDRFSLIDDDFKLR